MSSSPSLKEAVGKDSENASNSSAEGGGNNSDNSALVSLGNASFGFNFESDGGFHTGSGSGSNSPDEGDSDQGDRKMKAKENKAAATPQSTSASSSTQAVDKQEAANTQASQSSSQPQAPPSATATKSPAPMSAGAAAARLKAETNALAAAGTQQDAAAAAVANLNQIATDAINKVDEENEDAEKRGLKRKTEEGGGYKADQEGEKAKMVDSAAKLPVPASSTGTTTPASKKKKLDDSKREERNAREKERSFRISKQINELRTLLSSGGVIVPKGTKSSVLTEAANYIRMLQQHQYRSEIDRHQLVQQVQRIGGGALGSQAAQAVRHVAAQNGVWSLGNFGGVPPKSAMSTIYHPGGAATADETPSSATNTGPLSNTIEETDYRHIFNSCTIGMAIASMGGAFIDCNKFFCQVSNYTKQEVCSLTVFNLTARQDLQSAFDLISQMLSAPLDPNVTNTSCVLRGALRHRPDVGLSVKLIKGSDGVAKCFCVTLIQNPTSVFDSSRPIPATISVPGQPAPKDPNHPALDQTPAYTAG